MGVGEEERDMERGAERDIGERKETVSEPMSGSGKRQRQRQWKGTDITEWRRRPRQGQKKGSGIGEWI